MLSRRRYISLNGPDSGDVAGVEVMKEDMPRINCCHRLITPLATQPGLQNFLKRFLTIYTNYDPRLTYYERPIQLDKKIIPFKVWLIFSGTKCDYFIKKAKLFETLETVPVPVPVSPKKQKSLEPGCHTLKECKSGQTNKHVQACFD